MDNPILFWNAIITLVYVPIIYSIRTNAADVKRVEILVNKTREYNLPEIIVAFINQYNKLINTYNSFSIKSKYSFNDFRELSRTSFSITSKDFIS